VDGAPQDTLYHHLDYRRMNIDTLSRAHARISEPENQATLAHSFWRIVVACWAVSVVVVLSYSAYEFLMPVVASSESSAVPSSQALNTEELKGALDKLDGRTARFQELVN